MRRYQFLKQDQVHEALSRLRDSFLAAKDAVEVDEIINSILTRDEKIKIGRRIVIAEYIFSATPILEICNQLKVGKNTVMHVVNRLEKYQNGFLLIKRRSKKVEDEYLKKKYKKIGGSKQIIKTKVYSGIKRRDIKR